MSYDFLWNNLIWLKFFENLFKWYLRNLIQGKNMYYDFIKYFLHFDGELLVFKSYWFCEESVMRSMILI